MGGCNKQKRRQFIQYYVCYKLEVCVEWLQVAMQVFKPKCTTHDQALFLPFILVILSCSLCFYVLHLFSLIILGFPKAMASLQVLNFFKFKLFFSNEPYSTLDLLPHVASNVQTASSNTISPSSSSNLESKINGKEPCWVCWASWKETMNVLWKDLCVSRYMSLLFSMGWSNCWGGWFGCTSPV